jgi:hypothetical protein
VFDKCCSCWWQMHNDVIVYDKFFVILCLFCKNTSSITQHPQVCQQMTQMGHVMQCAQNSAKQCLGQVSFSMFVSCFFA